MRPFVLTLAAVLIAAPVAAQTLPRTQAPPPNTPDRPAGSAIGSPASGSQPMGLGTTGEGGVTAGSLGIGAGPAAVVNPPGAAVRDPLRPAGAAGPLREDPTNPDRPTPPASAYGSWSATGGATTPSTPPAGYRGAADDWSRHLAACQARYRTYDARTDTFMARPGVQARCRL